MGLLIEAYVVVVKNDSIQNKYPGEFDSFAEIIITGVFYSDGQMAGFGYMDRGDGKTFVKKLREEGLMEDDFAYVAQTEGEIYPAEWLRLKMLRLPEVNGEVLIAHLAEDDSNTFVANEGWQYKGSLSEDTTVVSLDSDRVELLYVAEDGLITLYDKVDKRVLYGVKRKNSF